MLENPECIHKCKCGRSQTSACDGYYLTSIWCKSSGKRHLGDPIQSIRHLQHMVLEGSQLNMKGIPLVQVVGLVGLVAMGVGWVLEGGE